MSPYVFHTRVAYSDIGSDLKLTMTGAMRLMQEAAILHSGLSGYSVMDIARTRVIWMLVQWRVRMVGDALWDEPLEVVTWPRTMEKLTSDRCFEIKKPTGETVAVGESCWLLVNADTGRAMRVPPEVASAYTLLPDRVFQEPMPRLPQHTGELTSGFTVQRRDLDTNRHVNNLIYLDYARQALPEPLAEQRFREVHIRYHRQLLLGDEVRCWYEKTDLGHTVQICGEDPRHVHCTVVFQEEQEGKNNE